MASLAQKDTSKGWQCIISYKKTKEILDNKYHIESNTVEHIQTIEEIQLHEYRNRIHDYEQILTNGKNWEYYKKIVNPYELVYTQRKYENFPDSICFLKPLSRSYFKMIEMLDLLQFFQNIQEDSIRTAHVCEGPGGFIEAIFEEASKQKKKIQGSIAMTLKSKQTNIPGWKRASHFLQKNKNVRIIFGEDDTGDIMKPENQQYFIDTTNAVAGVHLFTADGGFDFSYDYMKQEQMIFPLLLASTKIGFEVLKKGGVFILKLFDFYHKSTIDLLYFLSCHFEKWSLYKPGMSRPCNPEHYFIGNGFTGCTDEEFDIMRIWCSMISNHQPLESLYKVQYSDEFKNIIDELRKSSFKLQTEYLEKVFEMIDRNDDELIRTYLKKNEKSSYDWCIRFNVPIYVQRHRSIEESHSDLQDSSQSE
jgi:23S rRNA U2552 (ribose-2'-O)-methylase RlmE/FtsJ